MISAIAVDIDLNTLEMLNHRGMSIIPVEAEDFDITEWLYKGSEHLAAIVNLDVGIGVYVARSLRKNNLNHIVVGVKSPSSDNNWAELRSTFLENGGDDLIAFPPSPRELWATLSACHRRYSYQANLLNPIKEFLSVNGDKLALNHNTLMVKVNDIPLRLSVSATKLLFHLSANEGKVVSKDQLMSVLYGLKPDEEPDIKIVDVFVCKLRKALNDQALGLGDMIKTVWGRGYTLEPYSAGGNNAD